MSTSIEAFREHLAAVDPATLTRDDRLALLELIHQTFQLN
jgi:hypothetical protein